MPIFEYKALNAKGQTVSGVLDSDSPRSLRTNLQKDSLFLTEYIEVREEKGKKIVVGVSKTADASQRELNLSKTFLKRVKLLDVAILVRQMGTLLRSGIPMSEALATVVQQQENENLKEIMTKVRSTVNEGTSLADSMGEFPKIFPELYVNMIRVGEATGTLDHVFERLADFTEAQVKLRSKVISAMIYPVILLGFGVLLVSLMMLFVIPRVTEMFEEMGAELPLITQILIGASRFFGNTYFIVIPLIIAAVFYIRKWKASEHGREKWDLMVLKSPLFGRLIRLVAVSRFARTLATLLSSGVPILVAMDIVKAIVNNRILAGAIENARMSIREGGSISKPLEQSGEFPPMLTNMIAVGERTGQLEDMLNNVADAYDTQVDSKVTALTSILEPIMIIGMGCMVAFLVFAILLPMLKMSDAISGR
jgi:general secretion pathway protein F